MSLAEAASKIAYFPMCKTVHELCSMSEFKVFEKMMKIQNMLFLNFFFLFLCPKISKFINQDAFYRQANHNVLFQ